MIDEGLPLGLVADIGGTNARFALVNAVGALCEQRQYLCAEYESFTAVATTYLGECGQTLPLAAIVAVAGPVNANMCTLTNGAWIVDGTQLKKTGLVASCQLVNDFSALAASLPLLKARDLIQIGPQISEKKGAKLVVGPGTGLGAAYLVRSGASYIPLEGEGGHVSFAPVDAQETELLSWFAQKYERVSVERILSGRGLETLHIALAHINGHRQSPLTAREIMSRGLAGEPDERATLMQFCAMLGSFAGDLALAGGCRGGVYIGGGIVPRMPDLLAQSPFRDRFEAKGRMAETMKSVPSWLISHETPALLGAASFL